MPAKGGLHKEWWRGFSSQDFFWALFELFFALFGTSVVAINDKTNAVWIVEV